MSRISRASVSGAYLGVTMAVANALSYIFVLVLSRAFGPADFGGFSALSAYGIVLAVPAGAMQVIIARHVARDDVRVSGVRLAVLMGIGLAGATIVAGPLLIESFRLDSLWSAVWLGLTLIPACLTGAFQGILLGKQRLAALSALYVTTAVGRLAAGVIGALASLSVAEVFGLLFLAACIVTLQGFWVCRNDLTDDGSTSLFNELLRAVVALGAFITLTNIDTTLTRVFLADTESGGYALAATFGRAIGWGTQFIALLMVPRMQGIGRRRAILRAHILVIGLGLTAFVVFAIDPRWWMELAGGSEYTDFWSLGLACIGLGILWALVQLWLFAEIGMDETFLSQTTWAIIAIQTVVIWFWLHDSATQIIAVTAIGAASVVLLGLVRSSRLDSA